MKYNVKDTLSSKALEALEELASMSIADDGKGGQDLNMLARWGVYMRLQRNSNFEPNAEEISQLFRDERHVDHMLPILRRLTESLVTLQRAFKHRLRPIASALSKGLASLPDDLLTLIFEMASPPGKGMKQAVRLSHVSRRFRRVALGACRIWTTIRSDATTDKLKALVARSGNNSDLHVVLHGHGGIADIRSFLDVCIPLASRWSTLTIFDDSRCTKLHTVDEIMEEICNHHHQLELPRLHELNIDQESDWNEDAGMLIGKFLPSWTTPNLRIIKSDEYIPLPCAAYSTIRSFTTTLSLPIEEYSTRFDALLAFLASEPIIEDLDLTIGIFVNDIPPLPSLQLASTFCASLTSLRIQILTFFFPGGTDKLLHPLMRALNMPHLTNLSVSLELRYEDLLHDDEDSDALRDLVLALLPDPNTHTHLSSFDIELTLTKQMNDWGEYEIQNETLVIPLDRIPHVTILSVKTFGRLCFSREGRLDGGQECPLREFRLHDCEQTDPEVLNEAIASLKVGDAWVALKFVKVARCPWSYENVLEIVGAERLQFTKREEEDE